MSFTTLLIFIAGSLVNVMLNTIKTLVMFRKNKLSSSIINAVTYGFYTWIVVLIAADDLPLWAKMLVTAAVNFIGVWMSMVIMEHLQKDKLWKIEATAPTCYVPDISAFCEAEKISYSTINVDPEHRNTMFVFFCPSQVESHKIRELLKDYPAKYFVSESKTL